MGQSYEIYNIVTMPYLQVNARFIPYYKTAIQIEPTGTMIGELGIKLSSTRVYVNPNTTEALVNESPVSLAASWSLEISPGFSIHNEFVEKTYKLSIHAPEMELSFIRKIYSVYGLEPQFHFDYKAKLLNSMIGIHG